MHGVFEASTQRGKGAARPSTVTGASRALLCSILLLSTAQAAEPQRAAWVRAEEGQSDKAVHVLVAESFPTGQDAEAYVRELRTRSGIDLERAFAPYGYEVADARMFSVVAKFRPRLRTEEPFDLARWVMATFCIEDAAAAHIAAKKLGLIERGFSEREGCYVDDWPSPFPRSKVADVLKKAASAGYGEAVDLDVADEVIILGRAVTPSERAKIEGLAKRHGIPVRTLKSALSMGD